MRTRRMTHLIQFSIPAQLHVLWSQCRMCSCVFSLPLIFILMAASISHFLTAAITIFMFFFQQNSSPLFFLFSPQLFLCYPRQCRHGCICCSIIGLYFISLCFGARLCLIMSLKQREITFKPRIKLNDNIYN